MELMVASEWICFLGKKVAKYQVCAVFGGETYSSMEGAVYRLPGCATPPMLEAAQPSLRGTA
jgi:hypothetical protein